MGLLVDGKWQDRWYDTDKAGGRYIRGDAQFRNWVTADGMPGPSGTGGFKAEPGRYHLYVSLACPWGKSYDDISLFEGAGRAYTGFSGALVHGGKRLDL